MIENAGPAELDEGLAPGSELAAVETEHYADEQPDDNGEEEQDQCRKNENSDAGEDEHDRTRGRIGRRLLNDHENSEQREHCCSPDRDRPVRHSHRNLGYLSAPRMGLARIEAPVEDLQI